MCGIAGRLNWNAPVDPSQLGEMIGRLHHRGPDGHGFFNKGPIGLAHARLSIIDLSSGDQPMCNEDGTVWVVFNGEIFNYIELRADLLRRGHRFATQSDTEVLVHLYEDFGDALVDHLNGQFAFALWDTARQRLLLARDRTGIRPLFHTHVPGGLAFASEVKALFALPEVPRRLDARALGEVFTYWAPLPPHAVFEGIESLPPGHVMTVDAQGARLHRYWDWTFPPAPIEADRSADAYAEELRDLLIDAVRLQLRADVPVAAYLSGGLDSSIVTTLIRHYTDTPLRTFSLTFDDAEFDESVWQQQLVKHLGTDHTTVHCTRADIAAAFPRTIAHTETPIVRTAPAPMMLLAAGVRAAGYKVALTGEGADEVFGGYDIFKEARVRRFMARQPGSRWRPRLLDRLYPYLKHSPAA
ncbi:MAG: asparagine synthase (glutamine-hydrolyzing), partial [Thiomonas sp.]|nr:asparagine synthase (glutamine-hydrolyzing) [Thiomonas sp.]